MLLQLIRFGLVGGVATLVDVVALVILKEFFSVNVLIASAISFSVSVAVNYLLSMTFVFKSKNRDKIKEFIFFVSLSLGGLGLTEVVLWLGITFTSIHYLVIKFGAMVFETVYNFTTRKLLMESKEK